MKPPTEEFLYTLLWTLDTAGHPTWRNLNSSHEGWAYRHGLLRRIRQLEAQNIIEVKVAEDGKRAVRLTGAGMQIARKGIHPPSLWAREWDGRWRIVLFDLAQDKLRARLRRALRNLRFGCLQNSVWISPEPSATIQAAIAMEKVEVSSLVIFDGRPASGEDDPEIVKASWNWSTIAQLYENWKSHAAPVESPPAWENLSASARNIWFRGERDHWNSIVREDPFLPARLLPTGYPGQAIWESRSALLARLFA